MKAKIIKQAGVLIIAFTLLFTSVVAATQFDDQKQTIQSPESQSKAVVFEDGFETYDDWLIDFPPWTTIDVNGDPTFGHSAHTWPHQYDPYAFIIFNPATTTPPITEPEAQPHTGDKFCAGFNNDNAGYTNDDWLITPQLGPGDYDDVNFWAKSYLDTYNYELFEVAVSTTDTTPASFTTISPTEQPGHTAWEEFTYSLDAYDGQSIYIGIHMVSIDSWFLMIDDFVVTGSGGLSVDPGGPYTGNAGEEIEFSGIASGGTPPYTYEWDFGNGDTASGQTVNYAYPAPGEYDVILSATDDEGLGGSGATTATIAGPELSIPTVDSGLFKLKPIIRNDGAATSEVKWRITFDGGAFINQVTEGENLEILAESTAEIASGLILGIGATEVTVEAWIDGGQTATRSQTGFVFLFFIKMNAGGGI
jgi:hypothetical protein